MTDNTCIMCGEVIPEGIMVCPICEKRIMEDDDEKSLSGLLTEE